MNNSVVCCIFNHKLDNNTEILYTAFKDTFDTYVIDTYHKDNGDEDSAFINLRPDDHLMFFNNF